MHLVLGAVEGLAYSDGRKAREAPMIPHHITDGWATWSPLGFLRDVVDNCPSEDETVEATLTCRRRPELRSRLWWTLEWRDAQGKERGANASSLTLLMERAAEMEREARSVFEPLPPPLAS